MLDLLRKYQKSLFIVVTAMVVASFVFFGTFGTLLDDVRAPQDRVIGKAIDGSELRLLEIQALARFLGSDGEVIRNDLLRTQIAEELVRRAFVQLKPCLEQKLQRVRTFRAYAHPQAPFLSAKAVWERVAPMINREWSALQVTSEVTPDVFVHLAHLYQLQTAMPSELLRRVLLAQEQRFNWVQPDPHLRQDDLALFGFHSASDWFGREFVDLMAQFIHNAAIVAEEKGFVVSLDEARGDLRGKHSADALRSMGLSESDAVAVWRKVLLFRRSFQDVGKSVFLDRLGSSEFAAVASEAAIVDVYRFGSSLALKTALDALAFDVYVNAVLPKGDLTAPPTQLKDVAEVEKKAPALVATRYSANVSAVDKREAALRAPLKELWDFETKSKTWELLKKEFPTLRAVSALSEEDRFQALEKLDAKLRTAVDLFARRLAVDEHPEWIHDALSAVKAEEKQLVLSDGAIALPYAQDPKRLGALFEQILSAPETSLAALQFFETKDAVFRFENIAKTAGPAIKPFAESRLDGSLDRLIDARLEKELASLKAKLPQEKQSKPFAEIREDLAAVLNKKLHGSSNRLIEVAKRAKDDLTAWTRGAGEDPLLAQFKLECVEQQIDRTSADEWMASEAFSLKPQSWSSVHASEGGDVAFFFVKERKGPLDSIADSLALGQDILSADVQRTVAKKLIDTLFERGVIVLPLQKD